MAEDGATALDGDLPVNMSGGVLSTNPIGASGMIRFGEAAMQVRGQAGEHQVDGARLAVGHAYGGGSQFFAMWVVGSREAVSGSDGSRARRSSITGAARARAPRRPGCSPPRAPTSCSATCSTTRARLTAKEIGDAARYVHLDVTDEDAWEAVLGGPRRAARAGQQRGRPRPFTPSLKSDVERSGGRSTSTSSARSSA